MSCLRIFIYFFYLDLIIPNIGRFIIRKIEKILILRLLFLNFFEKIADKIKFFKFFTTGLLIIRGQIVAFARFQAFSNNF
jgi:hypothetical protein